MSNNWFDKYCQKHYKSSQSDDQRDEFDVFYEMSEFHCPVNIESAWAKTSAKINRRSVSTWQIILRVAAVLVIVAGLGFVVYNSVDSPPDLIAVSAPDMTRELQLPDGSIVTLSQGSNLSYDNATFLEDRVIQLSGKGYFDVVKNSHPFKIETNKGTVEVLGTSFNLSTHNYLDLAVYSGKVKMTSGNQGKIVSIGQRATNRNGRIAISKLTDPNVTSWKTGEFDFQEQKMKDVIPLLEEYYNVEIRSSIKLRNCRITANFSKASLEEVVNILSTVLNSQADQQGNKIRFKGKGCN